MIRECLATILAVAAVAHGAFNCPNKDGQYEDVKQCDKYYDCLDGVPTEKLCPDGLVFDPLNRKVNKCDHVFNVDCGDRLELQPPQPTKKCPRRNGFFAHPEPSVCNVFYNCIDGEAIEITCTTGLHFDEYSGTCVWPDSAGREFYVCLNGVTPREQGCSDGTVYNEEQQRCDAPENVPGCEDWYKDDDKKP
ncbi:hypothetical protein HZH66_013889 [Vespula vulgaris]|uniref:Chitin-binding type-2 domain-containing protein n=1 Tax=Vespula vulgaris TaxID=7454 RepID=A0A834MQL0_VESVU|nr:hypothetical protein HZH66_013889 [Vespula vulgaris]